MESKKGQYFWLKNGAHKHHYPESKNRFSAKSALAILREKRGPSENPRQLRTTAIIGEGLHNEGSITMQAESCAVGTGVKTLPAAAAEAQISAMK